jgi:hypothetical protein
VLSAGLYLRLTRSESVGHAEAGAPRSEAKSVQTETKDERGDARAAAVDPTGPSQTPLLAAAGRVKRPNVFGLSGTVALADVPEGRFRDELSRLSEGARRYALDKLGRLQVPLNDVASLSVEENGQLFYQCSPLRLPPAPVQVAAALEAVNAMLPAVSVVKTELPVSVSILAPPIRHSRPGSSNVIFLDFNGYTISGTMWNTQRGNPGDANYRPAISSYRTKAYDIDGFPGTFSDEEQARMIEIWERVAEDYRGFDVDVTTEEPAVFTNTTGRILITQNVDENGENMPSSTAAGVAYLDVFGESNYVNTYSPALVYANQLYGNSAYIAEGASHEMGHNLSLSHDGTTGGDEYYYGHGTGDNSWNTLMGGITGKNVTQWSKGEYYNANNLQEDLAVISSHLGYIPDDYTDSNATAALATVNGLAISGSGIISQTGEADRFTFESGAGAISISATAYRSASYSHGGNLDIALELYDVGGSLVASANGDGVTDATLNATVSGGTYFIRVLGSGSGSPQSSSPTGYTNYGSLGAYAISGTIISTVPVAPLVTSQPANQTVYAGQSAPFSVAASGYPAPTFQWQRLPAGSGVWSDLSNAGAYSGTTATTLLITNSATAMTGDKFRCAATNSVSTATSAAATFTVNANTVPTITTQPNSLVVPVGSSALFVAVASGAPVPTYQWKKNGVTITGATGSTFSIPSVVVGNAGSYTVVATNSAGTATSNVATLSVIVAPTNAIISITVQ